MPLEDHPGVASADRPLRMRRLVLVSLSPACLPCQPPQTALHLQATLQQKPARTKRALRAGSSIKTSCSQTRRSLQNTLSCHLHKRELGKTDGATQRCLCLGQRMLISWHRHLEPLCCSVFPSQVLAAGKFKIRKRGDTKLFLFSLQKIKPPSC